MEDMAEELGASNIPNYPDGRYVTYWARAFSAFMSFFFSFNTVWAVQNNTLTVLNEDCAGIDN